MKNSFVKAAMLTAALCSTFVYTAALAETVEITVLNTRGEDGIYRPALRVIRGGTVTFIAAGEQGLTEEILRDVSQLRTWAGTNIPATDPDDPIDIQVTTIASSGGGGKDCVAAQNAVFADGPVMIGDERLAALCDREETVSYCESRFPGWRENSRMDQITPEDFCGIGRRFP